MLHREDQIHVKADKYDIVRAAKSVRVLPGTMNSYNKTVDYYPFEGCALVLGVSKSYAQIYLPNRERKLIQVEKLIVVSSWKTN
mgnify:CR=1 FL=1|tara:strand:- start:501 stop:752 length:252 start_codon:yes stop_codon:yes gene_type:complete